MAQQQFTCALVVAMLVVVVGQVNCNLPAGFKRCDNTTASVEGFSVSACPGGAADSPCKVEIGTPVDFKLDFTSAIDFDKVHSHMEFTEFLIHEPSCYYGLKCPGKAGEAQSLLQPMIIEDTGSVMPRKLDLMRFYLADTKSKEYLVCIEFPVAIALPEVGQNQSLSVD